jgi:hypothetical protein
MVYTTMDKYGDVLHTKYGGKLDLGGCRTGSGTWWPDFGTTCRDFSPGGINHPTEFVFQNAVVGKCGERASSEPATKPKVAQPMRRQEEEKPTQFRHPQPEREALMKSTMIMPYKSGGRRKCAEGSNWKSSLSSGAEGMSHGGRYPIFAKGPLLENPDWYQKHPLKRHEDHHTIHSSLAAEGMPAGGATGTSAFATLVRSPKSAADLGMRDAKTIVREKSSNEVIDLHKSFKASANRLPVNMSMKSIKSEPSLLSIGSEADATPHWVATRTLATRDYSAAGHGGTGTIKRLYQGS